MRDADCSAAETAKQWILTEHRANVGAFQSLGYNDTEMAMALDELLKLV